MKLIPIKCSNKASESGGRQISEPTFAIAAKVSSLERSSVLRRKYVDFYNWAALESNSDILWQKYSP